MFSISPYARASVPAACSSRECGADCRARQCRPGSENTAERYFELGVSLNNGWWIGDTIFFGWHTATAYYPQKDIALVATATEGPGTANGNQIAKWLSTDVAHADP